MWGAVAVALAAATVLGGGGFDLLSDGWIASPIQVSPGPNPSIYVDLLQIQWWQGIAAIVVLLGLSPAPWILGLAVGRIQFTKVADALHTRELAEQKRHYEALIEQWSERYDELAQSNKANAAAAETHRLRAQKVTDSAFEVTEALRANTHVIQSLNEIAREASDHG